MSDIQEKPRYSIKKYIFMIVLSCTGGLLLVIWMAEALGFGHQGTLVVLAFSFPVCVFTALYGFYKGLVRHYALQAPQNLFFGGRY